MIECSLAGETWVRKFGNHEMRSIMRARHRTLEERLGLVALTFELVAEADRIVWLLKRARLLLLPLPASGAPCRAWACSPCLKSSRSAADLICRRCRIADYLAEVREVD